MRVTSPVPHKRARQLIRGVRNVHAFRRGVRQQSKKMHLCSRGRRPRFFENSEGAFRLPVPILDLPVFGSPQIELTTLELFVATPPRYALRVFL
jgi:hypothetical protein